MLCEMLRSCPAIAFEPHDNCCGFVSLTRADLCSHGLLCAESVRAADGRRLWRWGHSGDAGGLERARRGRPAAHRARRLGPHAALRPGCVLATQVLNLT